MSRGCAWRASIDNAWHAAQEASYSKPIPEFWLAELPGSTVKTLTGNWLTELHDLVVNLDDPVTLALIRLGQAGDKLTPVLVLHAMLPSLWKLSRHNTRHEPAEYLSTAYSRVMTFPTTTRTNAVMVNLTLDTYRFITRFEAKLRREWSPTDDVEAITTRSVWGMPQDLEDVSTYVSDLIQSAVQKRVVSPICGDVMHSFYHDGLCGIDTAIRHEISYSMVRYYCSSGAKAIQKHLKNLMDSVGYL